MKKWGIIFILFLLAGCSNLDFEKNLVIKDAQIEKPKYPNILELGHAISVDEVPVWDTYSSAEDKSIGELISDKNYMALYYGGLNEVSSVEDLEKILLNRLENFSPFIGIHYFGMEPPMKQMEEMYKEWMNRHDQISATLLNYYYFTERLDDGYFIHIENDFTMSSTDLNLVKNKMDEMYSQLKIDSLSDYEKVKALYKFVMDRMTYVSNDMKSQHSPMGFIFHGEGVCQAYAISLHMLLERAGIESRYIIGEINKEIEPNPLLNGHAWNMVKLDGNWYHLDPTWDDGEEEWMYFLVPDDYMEMTRSWEKQFYDAAPNFYNLKRKAVSK